MPPCSAGRRSCSWWASRVSAGASADDIKAKVAAADAYHVDYVGIDLSLDGFAVQDRSPIPFAGAVWQVAGLGDFDGDLKADILWRHPASGWNIIWQMDGFTVLDRSPIPTAGAVCA